MNENVNNNEPVQDPIDLIFQQADQEMQERKTSLQYKEKKRHIPRIVKSFLVMIVLAAAIGYAILSYALNFLEGMYPNLKETFLRGYVSAQEQLNAIPDDQITVDEYYTRELVNIVSADDLNERIGELKDLVNFKLVYQMNQSDAGNLLTTEEQAKYSALNKEYKIYISNGGDGSQKYVDAIKNNQIKQ